MDNFIDNKKYNKCYYKFKIFLVHFTFPFQFIIHIFKHFHNLYFTILSLKSQLKILILFTFYEQNSYYNYKNIYFYKLECDNYG